MKYFELATDEHPSAILAIQKRLESGGNPRDIKLLLAEIITSLYHSDKATEQAKVYFETAFQNRLIPENIPTFVIGNGETPLADLVPKLSSLEYIKSKSELLRLIKQRGVSINGQKNSRHRQCIKR